MDIDPYKIPAFQRKGKIQSYKKSDMIVQEKSINELKRENLLSIEKNKNINLPELTRSINNSSKTTSSLLRTTSWRKMNCIGEVTHYFAKIDVIAIKLDKPLKTGEHIIIQSPDGLFEQEVSSIQINRKDVSKAKKGDDIGIKVKFEPKINGSVYKVVAEG